MKIYKIYFRHYDRVLSVEAHHFSIDNGIVTFYTDEAKTNRQDIYLAVEAVGAIEAEDASPVSSSVSYAVGGRRGGKLHGF